jgi:hypothetical protein
MGYHHTLPMIQDEQHLAISRIISERIGARKQYALLKGNVQTFVADLGLLRKVLRPGTAQDRQSALRLLAEMNSAGGLAAACENLIKCIEITSRIAELDKLAKEAGVE